ALALAVALAAPAAVAVTAYAAGDVADCGRGAPADSDAARTARLIPDGAPVLLLGDAAYPLADRATLESCYGPTWGRLRSGTYAVPGNHDYVAGSARDFLAYFGARNGRRTYFRAALGDWWIIGLDSELGAAALARQQAWLEGELAAMAGDGRCIAALWHRALHSTGLHRGDGARMRPAWAALDAAGADVVLSGHEHFYEAFEPQDADGAPRASGPREFVVGTGGGHLVDLSLSSRHRAFARDHGVLVLDLERDRYRWRFLTVDGAVRDQGEALCRRVPQPVNRSESTKRATTAPMWSAATGPSVSTATAPRAAGTITTR
ncbi:MAG: metallophosphoesterase, partial [Proteobacteria bacterium]|nr:metallophosphoesterase [Pseudomonadota bacterium]